MLGLMQQQPLLISSLLTPRGAASRAAPRWCRRPATGARITPPGPRPSAARGGWCACCKVSASQPQDRVGTLAWNDYRHLEIYYADVRHAGDLPHDQSAPAPDDIAYIINHAGDSVLFVDPGFAPLIGGIARTDQGQRARPS